MFIKVEMVHKCSSVSSLWAHRSPFPGFISTTASYNLPGGVRDQSSPLGKCDQRSRRQAVGGIWFSHPEGQNSSQETRRPSWHSEGHFTITAPWGKQQTATLRENTNEFAGAQSCWERHFRKMTVFIVKQMCWRFSYWCLLIVSQSLPGWEF